ncbi:PorP/SprF family type IX secretion system membrane protein [Aquimarina pacifica]|uniref:PorP/SprF family type IX secretion system membrane protein n=1 Tax=Aquimarina pacifica TaxID=1296415 RepID=UPI000471740A|nr:type IX secretion system membrane protein PorP/SprF [Aquimarina pacifica]
MNLKTFCIVCFVMITSQFVTAQEGIPVYADYLSDNLYLVHPAMAGASNANKIRLTARKQWFDVNNAPNLQTLNINFRTGQKSGWGGIIFKDENGRFSQTGFYATYAYHLLFSRDRTDLNMLSFGLSAGFIQSNVNTTDLFDSFDPDPVVLDRIQKDSYYNIDVGFSYNYLEWYAHFTVKSLLPVTRDTFDNAERDGEFGDSSNQRRYVFSLGYLFGLGSTDFSLEPSVMYLLTDETQEASLDGNLKTYYELNDNTTLWGGMSYRRNLDGAEYSNDGLTIRNQQLQYFTPFLGVNYKKWIVGYTYSYQQNDVVISDGGFHQLTLGYNFGKLKERWDCNCPAVNSK